MNKITINTTLFLAVILICFSYSSQKTFANQASYKVGASSLNVRIKPAIDAEVIGSLSNGTLVKVLDVEYDWAKIEYNGQTGWIASHFLFQSSSFEGTTIQDSSSTFVTVAADGVRLRSGPGTGFSIIGYTTYGDKFKLIESNGEWQRVRLDNGKSAWIAGWLVTTSAQAASQESTPQQVAAKINEALTGQTIIIDAGHGGQDPGAIGIGGVFEKEYTLRTAQLVVEKLKNAGAHVIMTRSSDEYINVNKRVDISRSYPSSVFISIHYNAHENATAKGIGTYYYHHSDKEISSAIQNQLISLTLLQDDGVQFGDFYVLRNNHQHSLLLELGFITNQHDLSAIKTQNYQHQVANAITEGLINYFN